MLVCFIKLPSILAAKSLSYHNATPSLGLAYIAAAVRNAGHQCIAIDAVGEDPLRFRTYRKNKKLLIQGLSIEEIVAKVPANIECVCITSMFLHDFFLIEQLTNKLKEKFPTIPIIIGGENPSTTWEFILDSIPGIDYCVIGEGEQKIVELLRNLSISKANNFLIPGVAQRHNGIAQLTERGQRINNLAEIQRPAWDLFPVESYMQHGLSSGVNRGRSIMMLTSRGCPFTCKFCSAKEMWSTKYISRNPEHVVEEIEEYIKKYKIQNVDFTDLTAVISKKWILEFCELIKRKEIKITWQLPQGSRSEVIDAEIAKALYESGCRNYNFSPESGSSTLLKKMNKRLNIKNILTAMRIAVKNKLYIQASIIIGLPEESKFDLFKTFSLILKMAVLGVHGVSIIPFTPYPGSEYFHELKKKGLISFNEDYIFSSLLRASSSMVSYNESFSNIQLLLIQKFYLLSFYFLSFLIRPIRLVFLIKNFIIKQQTNVLDQFLYTKFSQLRYALSSKTEVVD